MAPYMRDESAERAPGGQAQDPPPASAGAGSVGTFPWRSEPADAADAGHVGGDGRRGDATRQAQYVLADSGARLFARILDGVLLVGVALALVVPAAVAAGTGTVRVMMLLFVAGAVLALLYEPLMIARNGQTVGKILLRVRVVRADGSGVPGMGRSFRRWAVPGLLAFIPFVGWLLTLACYASLLWDRSKQGWHDKAAGTVVVRA